MRNIFELKVIYNQLYNLVKEFQNAQLDFVAFSFLLSGIFLNYSYLIFNCFLRGPVYSRHYACANLLCGKWCVHQYLLHRVGCVNHRIDCKIN